MAPRKRKLGDKVEMNMTPMIDVVFQLLAFFLLTFKVFTQEGDFNIEMPSAMPKPGVPPIEQPLPRKLTMRANAKGELVSMHLDTLLIPDMQDLSNRIRTQIGTGEMPASGGQEPEVEFVCDPQLKYHYVIQAIDAVSGIRRSDGTVVPLIKKLKFSAPPKEVPKAQEATKAK
jgi:biopolymer transport protein ExbD